MFVNANVRVVLYLLLSREYNMNLFSLPSILLPSIIFFADLFLNGTSLLSNKINTDHAKRMVIRDSL